MYKNKAYPRAGFCGILILVQGISERLACSQYFYCYLQYRGLLEIAILNKVKRFVIMDLIRQSVGECTSPDPAKCYTIENSRFYFYQRLGGRLFLFAISSFLIFFTDAEQYRIGNIYKFYGFISVLRHLSIMLELSILIDFSGIHN